MKYLYLLWYYRDYTYYCKQRDKYALLSNTANNFENMMYCALTVMWYNIQISLIRQKID